MKAAILPLLAISLAYVASAAQLTYDAAGRLIAESFPNGAHLLYRYDASGNLAGRTAIPAQAAPSADLAVALVSNPDPAVAGAEVTFTGTVTNVGAAPATGVQVTLTLPAGIEVRAAFATQGGVDATAAPLTAALGTLAAGHSAELVVVARATNPGAPGVSLAAAAPEDATPGNNAASLNPVFNPAPPPTEADLRLTLAAGPAPVLAGGRVTLDYTVANPGPAAAANVTFTQNFPAELRLLSAVPGQGVITLGDGGFTANLGALPVGATATVRAVAEVFFPGDIPVSTTVTATQTDPAPEDNSVTEIVRAVPPTLIVFNAGDSGGGSLRQALLDANANPDPDIIAFSIFSAGEDEVPVIRPLTPLPPLRHPVLLDGFSQIAGRVEIDGSGLAPGDDGILIQGGGTGVRGLVINRCPGDAIEINHLGLGATSLEGCILGLDAEGDAALGNDNGLNLVAAGSVTIGGPLPWQRNVISGNATDGIAAFDTAFPLAILGNRIGTDATGNVARGNGRHGITLANTAGGPVFIGGTAPGAANLISGNGDMGVLVSGAAARDVNLFGNLVGTDAAGSAGIPNVGNGLNLSGVGLAVAGNVVSGNNGANVVVNRVDTLAFFANRVGTTADGGSANANGGDGILVAGAGTDSILGSLLAGGGNLVSGNNGDGIRVFSPGHKLIGNRIGVAAAGASALPNTGHGIQLVAAATGTLVRNNLISGNGGQGIRSFSSGAKIEGNTIGTDLAGAVALPNASAGVLLLNGDDNLLHGNLISGNGADGVALLGNGNDPPDPAAGNIVTGNRIGTDSAGLAAIPNAFNGIQINNGRDNRLGGTAPGEGNLIAFNGLDGVMIRDTFAAGVALTGSGNRISGNAIHGNAELGLDLGNDGVTPNDAQDTDDGPNGLQNFPVVTHASPVNDLIAGTLHSGASSTYQVELFGNAVADASGNGEGQTFLGSTEVTTDETGQGGFTLHSPVALPAGTLVTATATDAQGNTSEFSPAFSVETITPIFPLAGGDTVRRVRGRGFKVPITDLLTNDSAENGGTLTLVAVGSPSAGGATVSVADGFVVYEVAADFNDTDTFTYTVSNGEAAAQAVVTVLVDDPPPGPTLNITSQVGGDGTLTVGFAGIPGRRYQPQFTTSLTDPIVWQNLGEPLTAPANGQLEFTDTPGDSPRFYRVIEAE